jgi:RHS repeat-associated protein
LVNSRRTIDVESCGTSGSQYDSDELPDSFALSGERIGSLTHGRVLERIQALGNASAALTRTTQHHYDSAGRLDETTLPSGAVIGYAYGADGRVLTITVNGVTIVREIETFPFGEPRAWTEGPSANGFRYERSYDTDGRVAHHTLGEDFRSLSYDAAHRITGLLDTATEDGTTPANPQSAKWTFGFDGQDRLASASNAATQGNLVQLNLGWLYDATGNRREETRNGVTSAYTTAPTSSRLDAVGTTSRSYDNAGNTSSDGTYAYTYSARNRLSSARLQSTNTILARYTTNAFGERVCKAIGAGQCPIGPGSEDPESAGSGSFTQYVYDDAGHLIGEYEVQGCASAAGAGCAGAAANTGELIAEHVWLDDTPVAVIKPSAMVASHGGKAAGNVAVFAVEPDHLDTPRVIVNTSHQLVWRWDSSPFGDTAANEAPGGLAGFTYALRFPGQQYDSETQTHYNYFRDYEPGTGRYLESDPIGLRGGFGTFSFVKSSPVRWSDSLGLGPNELARQLADLARQVRNRIDGSRKSTVVFAKICGPGGKTRYMGAANSNAPSLGPPPSGITWAPRGGSSEHAEDNLFNGLGPGESVTHLGSSTGICDRCAGRLKKAGLSLTGKPGRTGRYLQAIANTLMGR